MAIHPNVSLGRLRIDELDGLRGLLALFVVLSHLSYQFESLRAASLEWFPILGAGAWYAVDVFFVMSGFVMVHVYGDSFTSRVRSQQYWKFMRARVARLYPLHLAVMLLLLAGLAPLILGAPEMVGVGERYAWDAFAASLLMLHSPWIAQRTWNYPAWSISAEWHAYVIFPFLMAYYHQIRRNMVWPLLFLGFVIPFSLYQYNLPSDQFPTNGWPVLLRVLPLFLAGMALYKIRTQGLPALVGRGLIVLTVACLCYQSAAPYAVLLIPFVLLVVLNDDFVSQLFKSKLLVWLGKISYSLYMTHALIDIFVVRLITKRGGRIFGEQWLADGTVASAIWLLCVAFAVILGYLAWRYIEVPGRRWVMGK